MKKIILISLLFLLIGCVPEKQEYYKLSIGDYDVVVGYDDKEFLDTLFDYEYQKDKIMDLSLFDEFFGECILSNIYKEDEVITYFKIYLDDYKSTYKLNDSELSSSISTNCEKFNGELIEKNGRACILQKNVGDYTNAVILYSDLMTGDVDELKKIEVYLK